MAVMKVISRVDAIIHPWFTPVSSITVKVLIHGHCWQTVADLLS